MKSSFVCQECGKFVMRTAASALICPDGHGKVVGTCSGGQYASAKRRYRREKWLEAMPVAEKMKRGFSVGGKDGFKKCAVMERGERLTSSLKACESAPEGFIAARVGDRAYVFGPMKSAAKKPATASAVS